ncbi:MAG: tetratricopeptide repeat protein [Chloroflexi bacterium]|nr:tetratricopeptide repeat protein [Chloroflexota bacterium]
MTPYRKIKRDYRRQFFSNRRRGFSGVSLLLLILILVCIVGAILAFGYVFQAEVEATVNEFMGTPRPTPTLLANEYAQRGFAGFRDGQLDEALSDFALAVTQQPKDVAYLYEYGIILLESGNDQLAVEIADIAIAAAENDARGYALKARALMWSDAGAAIVEAVKGLERNPDFAPLHAALAIAYTNIGRYAEGLQRGIRATELDPLDSFGFRAYSIPLIYTGRSSEAITALEKAVAISPKLTAPYFELAAQYRKQNYQEMAVGIYRRILELEPDSAKAYLRICQTYAEIGEFLEGTRFCETATEIDPSYAPAWQYLGQLQYNRRNYESALDSLENCVANGSAAVECYYIRGLAYYFLGECSTAWDVLLEAFLYTSEQSIIDIINIGLGDIRANCPGFESAQLPTPIPPTPVPPTPIGGI